MTTTTTSRKPTLAQLVQSLEQTRQGQQELDRLLAEATSLLAILLPQVTEEATIEAPKAKAAPARKAVAKKVPAKKVAAKKAPAKKTTARKAPAKKTAATKTVAKKTSPAKKTTLEPRVVTPTAEGSQVVTEPETPAPTTIDEMDPTVVANLRADGLTDDDIVYAYKLGLQG